MRTVLKLFVLVFPISLQAALDPLPLPRASQNKFVSEGVFIGGNGAGATLQSIRRVDRTMPAVERWVLNFTSDLPRFQLRYLPDDPGRSDLPRRIVLLFQALRKSRLRLEGLEALTRNSHLVKDVLVYPSIEEGDTAIELILRTEVVFDAFQSPEESGELILDLKRLSEN